ncbi:AAA family ATPase [Sulfurimonas sp. SAG-AH-194-C21]|nr:AAA family ATPase [Sulfurimonas sp. SAG-AH-194-C21]MDF1883320.1 AAA family ATPase [Sulfurimonas sp. SAG-AH-194-C21]
MLHLIVKNFGVLKDIDIKLNKTNLFIGDNGSGKSVLAKLITVVTNEVPENFLGQFKEFNIDFITDKTVIFFKEDENLLLHIEDGKLKYHQPSKYKKNILKQLQTKNPDNKTVSELKSYIGILDGLESQYIPAERNLISIFNQSISNMVLAKIPLPDTLLKFAGEYNKARKEIKELNLLNMKYVNKNGNDVIYYDEHNYLSLEHSSSGMQTALPMYLTLKYFSLSYSHIIIEEPELNLFPKTQIEAIKYIIQTTTQNDTYIMTHSPYVLSILNVLIFAYKASNTNNVLKEKISAIIPQVQQINPDEFSAYLIRNGISNSIKGKSTGMIQENIIDDIGGVLDDNFNELMDIYSEFKSD